MRRIIRIFAFIFAIFILGFTIPQNENSAKLFLPEKMQLPCGAVITWNGNYNLQSDNSDVLEIVHTSKNSTILICKSEGVARVSDGSRISRVEVVTINPQSAVEIEEQTLTRVWAAVANTVAIMSLIVAAILYGAWKLALWEEKKKEKEAAMAAKFAESELSSSAPPQVSLVVAAKPAEDKPKSPTDQDDSNQPKRPNFFVRKPNK